MLRRPYFYGTECAAGKTDETQCAAGRIFWLSPHGYSVLLMQYVIDFPRITAQNLLLLIYEWIKSFINSLTFGRPIVRLFFLLVLTASGAPKKANFQITQWSEGCGADSAPAYKALLARSRTPCPSFPCLCCILGKRLRKKVYLSGLHLRRSGSWPIF